MYIYIYTTIYIYIYTSFTHQWPGDPSILLLPLGTLAMENNSSWPGSSPFSTHGPEGALKIEMCHRKWLV